MTKNLAKTLIISACALFCVMFLIGIIQSFALNSLDGKLNSATAKASQMEEKLSEVEKEIEYKESATYFEDFYEQEHKYGGENDKIYTTNQN